MNTVRCERRCLRGKTTPLPPRSTPCHPLRSHGQRAFTIVEVMSVVAIIGILVMIVTPAVINQREKVYKKKAEADLEMLYAAIKQLAWDTGEFPQTKETDESCDRTSACQDIDEEVEDLTTMYAGLLTNDPTRFPNWKGPYLDEIPDDPWGQPYWVDPDYDINSPFNEYRIVVGSYGPNGGSRNNYDSDNIYKILRED